MREGKHLALVVSIMTLTLLFLIGLTGCAPCSFLPIPGAGPEIQFWVDDEVVPPGGCTILHWQVSSGEQYPVLLNGRQVPSEGEEEVCLEEPRTYELVVDAPSGPVEQTVAVQVEGMFEERPPEEPGPGEPPPPEEPGPGEPPPEGPGPEGGPEVINLIVDPDVIPQGGCAVLHWEVLPPEFEVLIDGQAVPPMGEREECPQATTTYELTVQTPGGPQQRSVTLTVEGGGPGPEPTPQQPAPPAPTGTKPAAAQPTATSQPPAQPTATTQTGVSADVRPADLYPGNQPQGNIWVRVVNDGPGTLTNKKVRISGSVTRATKAAIPSASGHNLLAQEFTVNLAPGQQQNINLGSDWSIDLNTYNYEFAVKVEAVGFTDPNSGNNTYKESFQAAATTQATLVVTNKGTANICYVHFVLSPAGANGNWGGSQPMGSSCIFPGKTYQWQLSPGKYDLIAYDGTHSTVLGQKLGVNISGTYNWNVP